MLMCTGFEFQKLCFPAYLRVQQQLLLVEVEESHRIGLGVIHEYLEARVLRRSLAIGSTRENALEGLLQAPDGDHRAVGRLALHALQGGAEPTKAEDEQGQDAAHDEEKPEPNAFVFRLGVLIRDPDFRH